MEGFVQDLKHSVRSLIQTPSFTLAAVAALALGIGANTAIFSVVNTVLLRPWPAPDPDRVVALATRFREGPNYFTSDQKFTLWRQQTGVLKDVAGFRFGTANVTGVDTPEQAQVSWVTSEYFPLYGIALARGRAFTAEETQPNGPQVAVLSDGFWKRAFGGDPDVVGKTISLNDTRYEVVGLVAAGVETNAPQPIDAWLPLVVEPHSNSQVHYFLAHGRLQPGVTVAAANAQLAAAADQFRREHPAAVAMGPQATFTAQVTRDALVANVRLSLLVLAGAVCFVLLIACANVGNLLLVRAAGRRREMAIRAAMGAGRGRIVRQLLTESLPLATVGGAIGLGLGTLGIRALLALNAGNIPRVGESGAAVTLDWRVLAFTIVVSLATTFIFGLAPAVRLARTDVSGTLKEGGPRSGPAFQNRLGSLLVVSELAMALVLLIGAALLIRTFVALRSVDPGIDVRNVLTLRMTLSGPRFQKTADVERLIRNGIARLQALPGVGAAAYSSYVPLEGGAVFPYTIQGRSLTSNPFHGFGPWTSVSSRYFDVFKIPLIRGRFFTDADTAGAPGVVIINKAMAARSWPNGDALNQYIFIGRGSGPAFEEPARQIVGIVADVHDGPLDRAPQPTMYVPAGQLTDGLNALIVAGSMAWIVRTQAEPHSLAASAQRELMQASGLPVARIRSMEEITARTTSRADFNMLLLTIFGVSAVLLAAIGVYGLMAYVVQQRNPEIAIRIALGADVTRVRNMIVFQGLRLAVIGVALGTAAALVLSRFIASFLFHVDARDPVVFVAAPLVLGAIAFIATWVPALRAACVDPADALRS
jgi:predicted permease